MATNSAFFQAHWMPGPEWSFEINCVIFSRAKSNAFSCIIGEIVEDQIIHFISFHAPDVFQTCWGESGESDELGESGD